MAESFTEEIIIDILLRLPAKSLVRFKSVCKRWRSLISDPGFVKSHLQGLKAGDLIPSQRIIIGGHFSPFELVDDEAPEGEGCSPLETVDYEALDGRDGEGRRVVVPHVIKPSWKPCVVGSCDGLVCLLVPGIFLIYNPTNRDYRELPILVLMENMRYSMDSDMTLDLMTTK